MMQTGREPHPLAQVGSREHAEAVAEGRHPGVHDALQWLTFSHLPESLQQYSRPFYVAAVALLGEVFLDSPELTTALNKMVEAKDAGVRAGIKSGTGRAGAVPRPQTVTDPPLFGSAQVPPRPDQTLPGNYGPGQPAPRPAQTPPPIAPPEGWGR